MIIKEVNNSLISHYQNPPIHIKEYYNYCLSLLINLLRTTDSNLNIIFGDLPNTFTNKNKTLKIDIQYEHTIVKKGGRGVINEVYGKTPTDDGEEYLIRIDRYEYYNSLDFVIEYGFPNLKNIETNKIFNDYIKKILVVEPLYSPPNIINKKRDGSFTIFTNNGSQRRDFIMGEFYKIDENYINVSNCFSNDCLMNQYSKSKIMINVHQTDHHHTFEGLRVLPALSQGVLIISEDVPLKESIPYSNFIIWSKYDDLPKTLNEVQKNYNFYFNKIFNKDLLKILNYVDYQNKYQISKILI
jgi:hypothetical protein